MALLEDAIYAGVQAHSGLCALLGGAAEPRAGPIGEVPDEITVPYLTWQRISGPRLHAMQRDPGLAHPRYQFSVWGESYKSAKTVAAQVIDCFKDWSGTVAGVIVQRSFYQGAHASYDPDTGTHQASMDFIIWHRELAREWEYPRVALSHANCCDLADSVLWTYDVIFTHERTATIAALRERAVAANKTEWLENVQIFQVVAVITARTALEDALPSWVEAGATTNPQDAVQKAIYENFQLGVDWFLRDSEGNPLPVWGGETWYMLNVSEACPVGEWGPTAGLTLTEYMASDHFLDVVCKSGWEDAFEGLQFEDGPMKYGVPCYYWPDDVLIQVGEDTMTCEEFRTFAKPSFDQWLIDCPGYLTRNSILTRSNGVFTDLDDRRDYPEIPENMNSAKLEHFGDWGDWPEDDLLGWTAVYFDLEDNYQPLGDADDLDIVQGWDPASCQCMIRDEWDQAEQWTWQRQMLALCLLGNASFSISWYSDPEQYTIETPPEECAELRQALGRPLGEYQSETDGEGKTVYWRYFKRGVKVQTVAFNPNGATVLGLAAGGTWFEGKWSPE